MGFLAFWILVGGMGEVRSGHSPGALIMQGHCGLTVPRDRGLSYYVVAIIQSALLLVPRYDREASQVLARLLI